MKKKILIVEDNLDLSYILQRHVEDLGHESILAMHGRQAVDISAAELPDLIIMDITLPEMDGLQAARLIRENPNTHSTPILAVTARVTMKDKEDCLQSGCDDYLAKPFTAKQLASRIEKLLM